MGIHTDRHTHLLSSFHLNTHTKLQLNLKKILKLKPVLTTGFIVKYLDVIADILRC
jgi:hypothetical protein